MNAIKLLLYISTIQILHSALSHAQASNFTITHIIDESGLYYEKVGEVRFTTTDWQLISYIDVAQIVSQRPRIPKNVLTRANETCYMTQKNIDSCGKLFGEKSLLEKNQQIQEYLDQFYAGMNDSSSDEA